MKQYLFLFSIPLLLSVSLLLNSQSQNGQTYLKWTASEDLTVAAYRISVRTLKLTNSNGIIYSYKNIHTNFGIANTTWLIPPLLSTNKTVYTVTALFLNGRETNINDLLIQNVVLPPMPKIAN